MTLRVFSLCVCVRVRACACVCVRVCVCVMRNTPCVTPFLVLA